MLTSVEEGDVSFSVADVARDVSFLSAILRIVALLTAVEAKSQLVGDCDSFRQRHCDNSIALCKRMCALTIQTFTQFWLIFLWRSLNLLRESFWTELLIFLFFGFCRIDFNYLLLILLLLLLLRRLNHFQQVDAIGDEVEESLETATVLGIREIFFGVEGRSGVDDFQQRTSSVE